MELEIIELTAIIVSSFCAGIVFPICWGSFKRTFVLENEEDFENKPQELNDEIEKKLNDLRNENSKLTVELMAFKKSILDEKGYIGELMTFYSYSKQVTVFYDYYVIDFESLKVKRKNSGIEEVFELDQKDEIFPTIKSAELTLLEKLEKEEFVKKELKEKYSGHPNEKIIKCGTTTEEACKNAEEYTKVLREEAEQNECANKVKEDLDRNPNIITGGATMFYMAGRTPEYRTHKQIIGVSGLNKKEKK